MKRANIFAIIAILILVSLGAAYFALCRSKTADTATDIHIQSQSVSEPAAGLQPDSRALEMVERDYLEVWKNSVGNLIPMLEIGETHILCYRRVWTKVKDDAEIRDGTSYVYGRELGNRIDFFLQNNETDKVSPIMSKVSEAQPFVRDLGEEYGIILDDEMLIFSKSTYLPLRLEPAPELVPSDFISPDYLKKWDYAWDANSGYRCGDLSSQYSIYSMQIADWNYIDGLGKMDEVMQFFLTDNINGFSTPLFQASLGWGTLEKLVDGRYALSGENRWVLTFKPSTGEAVNLYRNMSEIGENEWYFVAWCPYKSGRVELGSVSNADGKRVYVVDVYDGTNTEPKRIHTDIPFYSKQFAESSAPELCIYGDQLMFCPEKGVASVSLIDGEFQTTPSIRTYFKDNIAISVTDHPIPDENLEPWEQKSMLTVYLWPGGKRSEPYVFEAPEPLNPSSSFEDRGIKNMEYDSDLNMLTIYQIGWKHLVDLNTYEILTEDDFPVPPYSVYAISEDGRYTVASTYLGGGGDGHAEEIYYIDNETGKTKSLGLVIGGYGYWGVVNISGNIVAVTDNETHFYSLETGEKLPLTLPVNDGENTIGVVYDTATRRYLRATSPYAFSMTIEDVKDFTIRFDSFDNSGALRQTWQTNVKPGYEKFAAPHPIGLVMYQGKALFLECESRNYYGNIPAAIASLDPKSGEVTRMDGNFFTVSDGFLFTVSYNYNLNNRIQNYILRKYKGDTLLSELTVDPNEYSKIITFLEYDIKKQALIGWHEYFEREVVFDVKFND